MSVDRDGKVAIPQLVADESFIEKLRNDIINRGPDFLNDIEAARIEQEKLALEREGQRLARYDLLE